jgi:outer membrane receptor protein involved in Fe transport
VGAPRHVYPRGTRDRERHLAGARRRLEPRVDGRLHTLAGAATGKINLDFYGGGLGLSQLDQPVRYSLDVTGALAEADWQLSERSRWAVGLRYVYADVTPELRDAALFPGLPNKNAVTVSAPTTILEYDSRNNLFTPTRGLYLEPSLPRLPKCIRRHGRFRAPAPDTAGVATVTT